MKIFKGASTILICLLLAFTAHAEPALYAMDRGKIPFASLNGKWVFINYWASWCEPCLAEIPELNRFYEHNKNDRVAMFAVNYDALPLAKQKQLIQELDIRYPALAEDPRSALNLGHIKGVPVTFVFNPQGELVDTLYGSQTMRSLNSVLAG